LPGISYSLLLFALPGRALTLDFRENAAATCRGYPVTRPFVGIAGAITH
jgi:hypothetical protein